MNKSISAMKSIEDVCSFLRSKYCGRMASAKDYKDSYVINKAIELFAEDPQLLMSEAISERDREAKISKSINFRSDCFGKITSLAKILCIPEAEVCRRILYFSIDKAPDKITVANAELASLRSKVAVLVAQLDLCQKAVKDLLKEISLMEDQSNGS